MLQRLFFLEGWKWPSHEQISGCELTTLSFLPNTGCNTVLLSGWQRTCCSCLRTVLLFKASLTVYTSLHKLCYFSISVLLVTAVRLRPYLSSISTSLGNRFHSQQRQILMFRTRSHLTFLLTDSQVLNHKEPFFWSTSLISYQEFDLFSDTAQHW